MNSNFFNIIMLVISLYVLYSGIVGKGKLYQADNIKEECQEKFHSILRKMFLALGIIMLLMSACNFATAIAFKEEAQVFVFSDTYTAPDESKTVYQAGDEIPFEKANEYYTAETADEPASSGSMCAPGTPASPDSIANKGQGTIIYAQRFPQLYGEDFTQDDYERFHKAFSIAGGVLMGISVLMLVALFILINRMTDKNKKQEQRAKAQQTSPVMPSAAFNFDEDESPSATADTPDDGTPKE